MTQEDKQLLLKDLCGRLPHGVICEVSFYPNSPIKQVLSFDTLEGFDLGRLDVIPYLRPMSFMTAVEVYTYRHLVRTLIDRNGEPFTYVYVEDFPKVIDWLNKNMFDYRGLIEKGLALEAPEGMYKF